MWRMNVLVTGGAGFIGSHVFVESLVTGLDNHSNGKEESLRQAQTITGKPLTFQRIFPSLKQNRWSCAVTPGDGRR